MFSGTVHIYTPMIMLYFNICFNRSKSVAYLIILFYWIGMPFLILVLNNTLVNFFPASIPSFSNYAIFWMYGSLLYWNIKSGPKSGLQRKIKVRVSYSQELDCYSYKKRLKKVPWSLLPSVSLTMSGYSPCSVRRTYKIGTILTAESQPSPHNES